jgi:hypothetical protein
MFVNDDVLSPDRIKNTWHSRPKSNDDYRKDASVTVTRAAALGPPPPPPPQQQQQQQRQVATS